MNIPAHNAVNDIKNRYGKVIFSILDARENLLSCSSKPGANNVTISSEKIMPSIVIIDNTKIKLPWIYVINCLSSSAFFTLNSFNIGTNAWINAPSANNLLKKLGILKATKKASVLVETPNILAKIISLIKDQIDKSMKRTDTLSIFQIIGIHHYLETELFQEDHLLLLNYLQSSLTKKDSSPWMNIVKN